MFNFDIYGILLTLPGLIIGLSFHEFAHALAADKIGDPTPRNAGRLTLSPLAHIDPIGFLFLIFFRFGWAKPVPVNPRFYKNPKRDDILVSVAGPAMNLLLAFIFAILLKLLFVSGIDLGENTGISAQRLLLETIYINILLFVLNLLPLPLFDGYHILSNIMPIWKYRIFNYLEQYSTIIFILLAVTGALSFIISPIISLIFNGIIRSLGF